MKAALSRNYQLDVFGQTTVVILSLCFPIQKKNR